MSHSKLAAQLMDAHMMGDMEQVKKIQAEINQRQEDSRPKKKTVTIQINTVLNDDNSSAITVYDFLNKSLGENWWESEIETIERLLWVKYGIALEDINRDKVLAIRHLCRSDRAFFDWFEFNQLALSFCGSMADFERLRSPSPGMSISTVKTLNHIRPDRKEKFGKDVIKYICIILNNDGIYTPPPSINGLVYKEMDKMTSKPMKEKWTRCLRRYNAMAKKRVTNIEETIEDIQAKRLIKAEASAIEYGVR